MKRTEKEIEKKQVLMCCSDLSVKGGMVSVMKNYLSHENWGKYQIVFVPTHIEKPTFQVTLYFLRAYGMILHTLAAKKIAVAHLHTAERGSFYRKGILVRTLRLFGVKTVIHLHAAEFEEFYQNASPVRKRFIRRTFELADVTVVLSKRLIRMVKEKAPKAKVTYAYNAVSTWSENQYRPDATGILFLGRLGQRKGAYDLLDTIKEIDEELPEEIGLYMCGDGEVEEVKAYADQLGISHRIRHIGWIDAAQKSEIYKDVFLNVLPSYHEGLPMTILETMAYGIPSVTTRIASIPEVIQDGVNGFLIEPGDKQALGDRILQSERDRDLCMKLSTEAYKLVNGEFSLDDHVKKITRIYDRILSK